MSKIAWECFPTVGGPRRWVPTALGLAPKTLPGPCRVLTSEGGQSPPCSSVEGLTARREPVPPVEDIEDCLGAPPQTPRRIQPNRLDASSHLPRQARALVLWCFVLNPHRRPRYPKLLWCDGGKLEMSSPANRPAAPGELQVISRGGPVQSRTHDRGTSRGGPSRRGCRRLPGSAPADATSHHPRRARPSLRR